MGSKLGPPTPPVRIGWLHPSSVARTIGSCQDPIRILLNGPIRLSGVSGHLARAGSVGATWAARAAAAAIAVGDPAGSFTGRRACFRRRERWPANSVLHAAWSSTRTNSSRRTGIWARDKDREPASCASPSRHPPRSHGPRCNPIPTVRLIGGLPDPALFPRAEWLRHYRSALNNVPNQQLGYPGPLGAQPLREALTDYIARVRGVVVRPDRVLITSGLTQAIVLLCRALRRRGAETIAVEDPGFGFHREAIANTGLRVVPIPVDDDGLDVASGWPTTTSPPCSSRRRTPIRPEQFSAQPGERRSSNGRKTTMCWSSRTTTTPSSAMTEHPLVRSKDLHRSGLLTRDVSAKP